MLQNSLAHFGDLSGIVFNETSQTLVGGHQRGEVAHVMGVSDVTIERTYDPPTKTGTVSEGYIVLNGERHAFRGVRWDGKTEKAANIAANKGAGEFEFAALSQIMHDLNDANFELDLTMFDQTDRGGLLESKAFDSSAVDWDEALDKVPSGEQAGIKTMTFTLTGDQQQIVTQALDSMKKMGPFIDTGNENANGNALARLAEMYRG